MNPSPPDDLSGLSMLDLFRLEAENQTGILTNGLLEIERSPATTHLFETLMRAAHSLKGAARILNLTAAVRVAHALEDCFVAAQSGKLALRQATMDTLFGGVDLLAQLPKRTEANLASWETDYASEIDQFLNEISGLKTASELTQEHQESAARPIDMGQHLGDTSTGSVSGFLAKPVKVFQPEPAGLPASPTTARKKSDPAERVLRLTAENLNRLLALAGESLVESRWLRPFADSVQRLKRHHANLAQQMENLRSSVQDDQLSERTKSYFNSLFHELSQAQDFLADRLQELDAFDRRSAHLSQRLYLEVLRTRMRPFSDGVRRFPRMVRDLARTLGKEIKLDISGDATQVDRDILERLETPLAHLLRNAVDHGCESPEERRRVGKPAECNLRLDARHSAGVLLVTVADDGAGVILEQVRQAVIQKRLVAPAAAEKLSDSELLEFLFLPGFTLKETVTEISGRGFGLDIVQNMVKSVRGAIRLANQPGRGLRVQLQLPLTLSVLRALLVEVAGEPYAIPLSQINRTLKLSRSNVRVFEGRPHFQFGDHQVGLITAQQVLECTPPQSLGPELSVVLLGDRTTRYGLIVDRFLGERELVVQPLDARLGKIRDVSAAALMEDGAPVLILDVEEMVHSIERLASEGLLHSVPNLVLEPSKRRTKRVLAVDDSLTVRELERKLLTARGYHADVAVDGMDAWNAVQSGDYDLVITDIDMPRVDGVTLTSLIKKDSRLKSVPVLILSYKDREQDRLRGLEAGADYYLPKGSFHDQTLIQAVVDLIGEPQE